MKYAYPVVLTPADKGVYAVAAPDLEIYTQGTGIAESMYMARDAISMWICHEQDEGRSIPEPRDIADIEIQPNETKTLVDIDADWF